MSTRNVDKLKETVARHIEMDAVMQGDYWHDGKGCFIGCLAHEHVAADAHGWVDADRPDILEQEYGIPVMLVRILEAIFERLPESESVEFFRQIPEAIESDGKDLSLVPWGFLERTLRDFSDLPDGFQGAVDSAVALLAVCGAGLPRLGYEVGYALSLCNEAASRTLYPTTNYALRADMAVGAAKAAVWAVKDYDSSAIFGDSEYHAARASNYAATGAGGISTQRDTMLNLIRQAPVAAE